MNDKYIQTLLKKTNKKIIGNDKLKQELALTMYLHKLRKTNKKIDKRLPLVIGQTGTGKSYTIKTMCELSHIKCFFIDGSSLTKSGWRGNSIRDELIFLANEENINNSIIIIDEFDKAIEERENYREGLFYTDLLNIVEGIEIKETAFQIDTSTITFVFSGSFDSLKRVVKKRLCTNTRSFLKENDISESDVDNDLYNKYTIEDIIDFGIPIELCGRITSINTTDELNDDTYKQVLLKTDSSPIKQLRNVLNTLNVKLEYDDEVLDYIIREAKKTRFGLRALKSVFNDTMNDVIQSVCSNKKISEIYLSVKNDNVVIHKTIDNNHRRKYDVYKNNESVVKFFLCKKIKISKSNVDFLISKLSSDTIAECTSIKTTSELCESIYSYYVMIFNYILLKQNKSSFDFKMNTLFCLLLENANAFVNEETDIEYELKNLDTDKYSEILSICSDLRTKKKCLDIKDLDNMRYAITQAMIDYVEYKKKRRESD